MPLNKLVAIVAFILAGTAQAEEMKCPPLHGKNPLSGVSVYDGPPDEMADLISDKSSGEGDQIRASWEVGYIHDAGRSVYLVCKYGKHETITVKAENKVQTCIYRTHPGKTPVEVFCK
jgi:hypothetical protein